MDDTELFLQDVLPRLRAAEISLHEGDAGPRKRIWCRSEPVSLFGAEVDRQGRDELEATFDWVGSRFTACGSFEYEVMAAGVSGDLGYMVAYEHITATANGAPVTYSIRATTVFRREDGEWRVAHRHGDGLRDQQGQPRSSRVGDGGPLRP